MKNSFIGILIVLCLLLSACGNTLPEVAQTQPTETTEATVPTQEEEIQDTQPQEVEKYPEAHEVVPVGEDYFQYGNMQKNLPAGNFLLYGDEILFWTSENNFILSYEIETGKVRPFCIKEDCDHENDQCEIVDKYSWVAQYGGKLYHETNEPNKIDSIQVLENGKWEDVVKDVYHYWYNDGDLYTVARVDRKLQVYEDGAEEPKTITENYTPFWNMIFDGYLYGHEDVDVYRGEVQLVRADLHADTFQSEVVLNAGHIVIDGTHIYYVGGISETEEVNALNFPGFLYRCDMDGSNKEALFTRGSIFPASLNFDDEYIYFRTGIEMNGPLSTYKIYRMSKEDPTKQEMIAALPESVYQIFTVPGQDLLFATGATYYEGNTQRENIYVMNADGSNLRQLELP